jgi:hypothetical protein
VRHVIGRPPPLLAVDTLLKIDGNGQPMSQTRSLDYPAITKRGFQVGVVLFLVGALGEALLPALFGPLPEWETTLLFDAEVIGLLVAFFVPLIFGLVLPLTE